MKLLMIINAKSGVRNSKTHLIDAIDVFCKYGYTVTTYVTQKPNDAYEYLLKNEEKYDVVCAFGGDGTMNEVSNALMKKEYKPMLGYFPSGTMNDFGSNFNLGTDFKTIAERICTGKENPFDVGECNGTMFNYVAAFGAMCDVPYSTDRKQKEALGSIAYILNGISKIGEIKPIEMEYKTKQESKKINALFGLVYSGNRVSGLELDKKEESKVDDGLFTVLIVEYIPSLFDAPDLIQVALQQDKYIHKFKTNNIQLMFKNKTIWTLDGEKADLDTEVNITLHHNALNMKA